jgi:hypothetical protein
MFTKRNPFAVWLLVGLTLGIYGLVLFHKMNRELATALQLPHTPTLKWYSQLVPVWGIVGLHVTAKRINVAARDVKVVSPTAVWLFWSWFFVGPYARLQAALNRAAGRWHNQPDHPAAAARLRDEGWI